MNENFYKQLIEESPIGYAYHKIICDEHGIPCDYKFIEVNAAFEALTGLKSSNIVGKKITEVLPNISKIEFDWIAFYGDIAINGGKKEIEQYEAVLNKWYRINVYSPEINYFITNFSDISKEKGKLTEMKNLQADTEREKAEVEKSEKENSLKTEFFTNISHEFRTPLNVMLSAIQLFELYEKNKKNLTREKTARHLKSMKQNSLRLLRLVNNLIDVSKIDSGFYEPTFNNYNIVSIIKKVLYSIKDYAKQKNIKIKFKSDLKEKIVKCDVDMIERVMFNLISNAIKFSEENCFIQVSITNKVDAVVITVKDNGIGIQQDKLEVIFEKYMQASRSLSRMSEGSGIGLSLTKSLVEMHGGTINVKSNYGKGSEFIIEIPNVQCMIKETISNSFDDIQDKIRVITKMNLEFSDIYL